MKEPSVKSPSPADPLEPDVLALLTEARQARLRNGLTITALGLLICVLLYVIVRELALILRPLLVAVLIAYLIVPAHRWLVRHRIRSWLAYIVIVGTVLVSMYFVARLAFSGVAELSDALPGAMAKLQAIGEDTYGRFQETLRRYIPRLEDEDSEALTTNPAATSGPASQPIASQPSHQPASAPSPTGPIDAAAQKPPAERRGLSPEEWLSQINSQLIVVGQATLGTFAGFFTAALVVIFYLIFLLAEEASLPTRLVAAFGANQAGRIQNVITKINIAISRYLATKTFVSFLVGALTAGILFMFQVRFYLILGLVTFFMNFIPYVGSLAAVLLAVAMSIVQFESIGTPTAIALLLFLAQQVTGSYLEPKLLGQRLGVSPLMILLSLAFWGYTWGVPGMILSAPLIVTLKIILENMDSTRPLAMLMSNVTRTEGEHDSSSDDASG